MVFTPDFLADIENALPGTLAQIGRANAAGTVQVTEAFRKCIYTSGTLLTGLPGIIRPSLPGFRQAFEGM